MWLVITYLLNFADSRLKSIIVVWWSCFISRRKAVLLTFWNYGNTTYCWCCSWMRWWDAVMGWRDRENPGKVSFVRQGALGRAHWERLPTSITRESDTVWWWYPEQKIGYENSVRYKISLPEMKLPSPRTDPSSSASPGLNRRAHWAVSAIVSLASHPFLCIPELDTIQWMKNSTIMNQNKHALSHLVFFSLFPPNANDCVCSC